MVKAVIFDNDGVLVDSLNLHWMSYCEAIGKGFDKMDILSREGMSAREIIHELTGLEGQELDLTVKRKRKAFDGLRNEIEVRPSAIELIKELRKRDVKVGMATGTMRGNIDILFGDHISLFDVVITADDSKKHKPDPEPYLMAAGKLGVCPLDCIVVENAPLGVKAAKAAGMRCIAITSTLPESYLTEADVVVDDIKEVLKWI